ncbi:MAG: chloride channel protein [Caulobacterales bacterium 32-69-10]|nr:MAG: chloride channel protein [Caulobacterales bacterium 32-69-10]
MSGDQPSSDPPRAAGAGLSLPLFTEARGRWAQLRALVRSREVFLVVAAILVGAGAGLLVTIMAKASQLAHVFLFGIPLDQHLSASAAVPPLVALTAPVAGGLILGAMEWWRRHRNIPQAVDPVEANALRGGRMSLRDSLVVSLQTLISNGCGASVGLEAGYTQAGAGLASRLGILLRLRRGDLRILVGAGAAAAIAAAFGAPLTGAFYAFELIIGLYSVSSVAPVMAASIAGVMVAEALGGAPYSIQVVSLFAVLPAHFPIIVLLGLLVGALGIGIMRSVALVERGFELSRLPYWIRPAIGGFAVGGLALITPQVLAAGHGAMQLDIPISMPMTALVGLIGMKLAASLISLGSGFRGGLFFASLFVGALCGKLFGQATAVVAPALNLDPTICMLAGMGTLAVAVVGGPLTMTFLVLETTRDFSVTGAVLAACVAASLFVRETFGYSFSTWRLHLRGETIRSAHDVGWVRQMTVGRLMRRDPASIDGSASVAEFRRRYPLGSTHAVVVVDENAHYVGMLSTPDAFAEGLSPSKKVAEIARQPGMLLTTDLNVKEAMAAFDRTETETLAVVDSLREPKVIGLLTEKYAARRYAEELDKANRGLTGD